MELVVDANVLFSSLIRERITRKLMLNNELVLYAPEFIIEEFLEHIDELENKTYVKKEILREKVYELIIQSNINIVPKSEIASFTDEAKKISMDPDDVMYFALALKLKCPIWSNDKELKKQDKVKILSTEELIELIK